MKKKEIKITSHAGLHTPSDDNYQEFKFKFKSLYLYHIYYLKFIMLFIMETVHYYHSQTLYNKNKVLRDVAIICNSPHSLLLVYTFPGSSHRILGRECSKSIGSIVMMPFPLSTPTAFSMMIFSNSFRSCKVPPNIPRSD